MYFKGRKLFRLEYEQESPVVRKYVDEFYGRLLREKKIDVPSENTQASSSGRDWKTIDMNSLRNKDIREIGSDWLCYQALTQLGIDGFLFVLFFNRQIIN
jgi:hypothetical protein